MYEKKPHTQAHTHIHTHIKKKITMMLVFQFLAWDRHKNVEELNRLMGSQTSLITGSPKDNADINKRLIKKPVQLTRFHSKRTT